jgi:hypothetical protein
MYCPECGNDAASAKFCPECGANLSGVKDALGGKPAAKSGGAKAAQGGGSGAGSQGSGGAPKRISPAVIWGGFAALAVVVILVVIMFSGGFGGDAASTDTTDASAGPVQAVDADTSGSYDDLVARANGLYDKGDAAFQNQDFEQGGAYFAAAAKIYAAAWKKQATDPGVGTDLSVALFYSGDIDGALQQIDAVLKANPEFQKGWLNKGIFLSHQSRLAEQNGDKKAAKELNDEAKVALTKAVAIDAQSEAGKQADASLQQLSQ